MNKFYDEVPLLKNGSCLQLINKIEWIIKFVDECLTSYFIYYEANTLKARICEIEMLKNRILRISKFIQA